VPSPSMDDVLEAVIAATRGVVVAAAGCGKTELIARTVADQRSGRQLVLTHTHAGVAALKRRFEKLRVPTDRYHLDTIASWSMRYGAAYPMISRLPELDEADLPWSEVYPAARRVLGTGLARKVFDASYDGVLVDEYQDCSSAQHEIVAAMADILPVRVVGDPMQAIFGFRRDDPMVAWGDVERFFEALPALETPYRWWNANRELGDWLVDARSELMESSTLTIGGDAPVTWSEWNEDAELEVCRASRSERGIAAIKRSSMPNRYCNTSSLNVAMRLGGSFNMVEAFDDPDLPRMADRWTTASGGEIVADVHDYAKKRMVRVGPELKDIVAAVAGGRPTNRFAKYPEHRVRLHALADEPTPARALAVLDGFKAERGWATYRPEGMYQLRSALTESIDVGMSHMPDAVAAIRARARHRGRLVPWRTVGTTLLLKGLEFDHAMVLDGDEFSRNELYVAITRGARSLTVLSSARQIRAR
jgi:hypothetical protein